MQRLSHIFVVIEKTRDVVDAVRGREEASPS